MYVRSSLKPLHSLASRLSCKSFLGFASPLHPPTRLYLSSIYRSCPSLIHPEHSTGSTRSVPPLLSTGYFRSSFDEGIPVGDTVMNQRGTGSLGRTIDFGRWLTDRCGNVATRAQGRSCARRGDTILTSVPVPRIGPVKAIESEIIEV